MTSPPGQPDVVLVEIVDRVAVLTLNRPEVRNALNGELRSALHDALVRLDAAADVAAIVLTGSDPAFCAGLDLREVADGGLGSGGPSGPPLAGIAKPIIGAVNGPAVTGGLEIALGCDFLIASERAAFADTHARVGVMPGWGLTVWLPEAIGARRARQMSFTGNYVDANAALEWGLVNEVVAHDQLVPRARALAADMATIAPGNLRGIKQAYRVAAGPVSDAALAAEREFSAAHSFDRDALARNRESIQERGRRSAAGDRDPG